MSVYKWTSSRQHLHLTKTVDKESSSRQHLCFTIYLDLSVNFMKPDVSLPPSLPFIWHFGNFPGRGRVKVTCICNFVIHHNNYFPQFGGDPTCIGAPIYNTTPNVKKPFLIVLSFLANNKPMTDLPGSHFMMIHR